MGLYVVAGYFRDRKDPNKAGNRASCRKRLTKDNPHGKKLFFPTFFKVKRKYSSEEITPELVYKLCLNRERNLNNCLILPNVPDTEGHFQRKNEVVGDQGRNWFQLDIDWGQNVLDIDALSTSPRSLAREVLKHLGLPTDICFVAQRSSTAHTREDGIRLRIWLFLDRELDEAGLWRHFGSYDIDTSMIERGRCHYYQPAITETGTKTYPLKGPSVELQQGPLLAVDTLKQNDLPRRSSKVGNGFSTLGMAYTRVSEILQKHLGDLDELKWSDLEPIFGAIATEAENNPDFDYRRGIHRWMMEHCYKTTGEFKLAHKYIKDELLGNWSKVDLMRNEVDIKHYLSDRWSQGDIKNKFIKSQTTEIKDVKDLGEIDLRIIPKNGILMLKAACGTGKTNLAKEIFKNIKPDSSLAICFTKATVKDLANSLDMTYYEDLGKRQLAVLGELDFYEIYPELIGKEDRNEHLGAWKSVFMKNEPHVASTIQSLNHYNWEETQVQRNVVFLDEIEHILEELYDTPKLSRREDFYKRCSDAFYSLINICANADLVILADDKASSRITGWFIDEIKKISGKEKHLLLSNYDYLSTMDIGLLQSQAAALNQIRNLIEEGKNVAINVDFANGPTNPEMTKWHRAITDFCSLGPHQVKSYEASDFDDGANALMRETPEKLIPALINDGVRVIICSPWSQVGWDYRGEGIDATVNIFCNGFTHAHDVKQAMRRWRLTHSHYVYINPKKMLYGKIVQSEVYGEIKKKDGVYNEYEFLREQLNTSYMLRRESILIHFLEEMAACKVQSLQWIEDEHTEEAKKYLKAHSKEARKEALEIALLDNEEMSLSSNAEITDALKRKALKWQKRDAVNLIKIISWTDEEANTKDAEYPDLWFCLQREIVNQIDQLFKNYSDDTALFDWILNLGEPVYFHVNGSPQANAYQSYIKEVANKVKVAIDLPLLTFGNWRESPRDLIKALAKILFLDVKVVKLTKSELEAYEEKKGDEKLGMLYKRIAKDYQIKGSAEDMKEKVINNLIEKGFSNLSGIERDYYLWRGDVLQLSIPEIYPKSLVKEIESLKKLKKMR